MPLWSKSKEEKNPLINKETPEERTQRERSELLTPPKKAGYRATDTDTESVPSAKPTASRLKVRKKYHPPVTTDEAYTSDEESACVSFPVARSITPIVQVAAAGDESQEEIQPAPLLNNNAEDKTVFLRSVQISFYELAQKNRREKGNADPLSWGAIDYQKEIDRMIWALTQLFDCIGRNIHERQVTPVIIMLAALLGDFQKTLEKNNSFYAGLVQEVFQNVKNNFLPKIQITEMQLVSVKALFIEIHEAISTDRRLGRELTTRVSKSLGAIPKKIPAECSSLIPETEKQKSLRLTEQERWRLEQERAEASVAHPLRVAEKEQEEFVYVFKNSRIPMAIKTSFYDAANTSFLNDDTITMRKINLSSKAIDHIDEIILVSNAVKNLFLNALNGPANSEVSASVSAVAHALAALFNVLPRGKHAYKPVIKEWLDRLSGFLKIAVPTAHYDTILKKSYKEACKNLLTCGSLFSCRRAAEDKPFIPEEDYVMEQRNDAISVRFFSEEFIKLLRVNITNRKMDDNKSSPSLDTFLKILKLLATNRFVSHASPRGVSDDPWDLFINEDFLSGSRFFPSANARAGCQEGLIQLFHYLDSSIKSFDNSRVKKLVLVLYLNESRELLISWLRLLELDKKIPLAATLEASEYRGVDIIDGEIITEFFNSFLSTHDEIQGKENACTLLREKIKITHARDFCGLYSCWTGETEAELSAELGSAEKEKEQSEDIRDPHKITENITRILHKFGLKYEPEPKKSAKHFNFAKLN